MQKVNQAYIQTQLTTVGQGELLLLLYDGALKFLAQAREKIIAKDYAAKGVLISKALDIISELDASLNEKAGGELATNLHQLYFMCSAKLLQANLRMDPALLDISINILSGLRSAYAQIITTPEAKAAGAQIAAKQSPTAITAQRAVPIPSAATAPGTGAGKFMVNAAYRTASTFGGASAPQPVAQPVVLPSAQLQSVPAAPSMVAPVPSPISAPMPSPIRPLGKTALAYAAPQTAPQPPKPLSAQQNQALGQPAVKPVPSAPQTAQPSAGTPAPVAEPPASAPQDLTLRRSAASARYGKMAQTS